MSSLPPLKQGLLQLNRLSNKGTRIVVGRPGYFDQTQSRTWQLSISIAGKPGDVVAVRPIFITRNEAASNYVSSCWLSTMANTSDLNNSGGAWVQVTRNGQITFPLDMAPKNGSGLRLGYTVPDWIVLPSAARDDGGTRSLYVVRAYIEPDSLLTVGGNGTDDLTNWATKSDGRIFAFRYLTGDYVSNGTARTNWNSGVSGYNTNQSQCPIVGLQYLLANGLVCTVGSAGDSIMDGAGGTYIGENYTSQGTYNLDGRRGVTVEASNYGWSGQGSQASTGFKARILDILESEVAPDIMVFELGSMNDPNPTVTTSIVNNWRYDSAVVTTACDQMGVVPIPVTVMATGYNVHPVGSSDSLRRDFNASCVGMRNLIDVATPMAGTTLASGPGTGQQEPAASLTDVIGGNIGAHPTDAGKAVLSPLVEAKLRKVIGL